MTKPRKIKRIDTRLDDQLNIEELTATHGDEYDVYAMNNDTAVPQCSECGMRARNHGKFERQYYDYTEGHMLVLHYLFYKYKCTNPDCSVSIFQKPVDFAREGAHITNRLEDRIISYAMYLSYMKVSEAIDAAVSKQAVGQILKRWINYKDEERGFSFETPSAVALFTCELKDDSYLIAINPLNSSLPILDVIPKAGTQGLELFFSHLDLKKLRYVITDCNPVVIDAIKIITPQTKILADIEALYAQAEDEYHSVVLEKTGHYRVNDRQLLYENPYTLDKESELKAYRILKEKPIVRVARKQFFDLDKKIHSQGFDVIQLMDWLNETELNYEGGYAITRTIIKNYWNELMNFYLRRTNVNGELYKKIQKLNDLVKDFKSPSGDLLRARILYGWCIGEQLKNPDQKWSGVPYEKILQTIKSLHERMTNYDNK